MLCLLLVMLSLLNILLDSFAVIQIVQVSICNIVYMLLYSKSMLMSVHESSSMGRNLFVCLHILGICMQNGFALKAKKAEV